MTTLALHLTAFLRRHLPHERRASQHTCAAYAYSFQLLLTFAAARLGITPSGIEVEQLDPPSDDLGACPVRGAVCRARLASGPFC